ncbi:L,D-transpeptidase [Streptomyces sp. NPDC059142]|uniref:L,D-transpeptidase n=1 Tax=Streptomyces sp. NPDC059142 TaxID=3346739 RepID=UPI003681948F
MISGANIKTDHTATRTRVRVRVPSALRLLVRFRALPRYGLGAAGLCALALTGCSFLGGVRPDEASDDKASTNAVTPAAARPARPSAPAPVPEALERVRVNVEDGAVVGVGMPMSLVFEQPVPVAERAAVERALRVTSSPRVTGAWSWVKDRNLLDGGRLDYRPREYWPTGTKVTLRAGSGPGADAGPGGAVNRRFTVGRSLVATVDVRDHSMTVVRAGVATRVPITAGAPGMDTWNGVMVVAGKERRLLMDSSTVGFGDEYKGYYNYAVHLTSSGTYLHENPMADAHAGRSNVTHGCVGLPTDGTARRFFEEVIPGDVVQVTGAPETVDPGNGYGDWNVPWSAWLAGSALR